MTDGVQPPLNDAVAGASRSVSAGVGAGSAPMGDSATDAGELTGEDLDLLMRAAADANSATAAGATSRPRAAESPAARATASGASFTGRKPTTDFGPDLPEFSSAGSSPVSEERISMLSDVNLNVKIELGRTRMLIEDVLRLDEGSVVELDKLAGDPVDVFANDRLIARGEVLVLNDSFCVRISEVFAGDPHRVV